MQRFDDNAYYRPGDEAMRLIAKESTLRQWRHIGSGPPYVKLGNAVLYRGCDLNGYLDERLIRPAAVAA